MPRFCRVAARVPPGFTNSVLDVFLNSKQRLNVATFFRTLALPFTWPAHYHFWGSIAIVLFSSTVIIWQVNDRFTYANGSLKRDVEARWGAPIRQPSPTLRYVASDAAFNTLTPLAFDKQKIQINATMNYRKRGLVYFSGFDFTFDARYFVTNPAPHPIDVVFVFPIQANRNRILLSDLVFAVDDVPQSLPLHKSRDKLVWTGRLATGSTLSLRIGFAGRGLEQFVYRLDPALPARGVDLGISVIGGENFDYPNGVVPAQTQLMEDGQLTLNWQFPALQSGVPIGLVLPSEESFDTILTTMTLRSWAPFTVLFACLVLYQHQRRKRWSLFDAWFMASLFAFFYVLLAYLAAYMNFFAAFALSSLIVGVLLTGLIRRSLGLGSHRMAAGLVAAALVVPSLAVTFPEHTGLIYTLEILSGLIVVAWLSSRGLTNTAMPNASEPETNDPAPRYS